MHFMKLFVVIHLFHFSLFIFKNLLHFINLVIHLFKKLLHCNLYLFTRYSMQFIQKKNMLVNEVSNRFWVTLFLLWRLAGVQSVSVPNDSISSETPIVSPAAAKGYSSVPVSLLPCSGKWISYGTCGEEKRWSLLGRRQGPSLCWESEWWICSLDSTSLFQLPLMLGSKPPHSVAASLLSCLVW